MNCFTHHDMKYLFNYRIKIYQNIVYHLPACMAQAYQHGHAPQDVQRGAGVRLAHSGVGGPTVRGLFGWEAAAHIILVEDRALCMAQPGAGAWESVQFLLVGE
jgi:hypothetical protein